MIFHNPFRYCRPKKPIYNTGILVIESDDGAVGDYTHWLPWFIRLGQQYNQFYPYGNRTVVGCSAVNTSVIGHGGRMNVAQIKTLHHRGWEILSHGTVHVGLGAHTLTSSANSGDTQITVSAAGQAERDLNVYDRKYTISNGEKQEIVTVTSVTRGASSASDGQFHLADPLSNSYSAGAEVQMTQEEMNLILGDAKDAIAEWVGDCKHHVYTYHSYNSQSHILVANYFDSARGNPQTWVNPSEVTSLFPLPSQLISPTTNPEVVCGLLDEVSSKDGILIVYGHGETDSEMLENLDIIITYALDKGVKIMTHTQALSAVGLTT